MLNLLHITPSAIRERRRRARMSEPDFGLLRSTLTANSVLKMLALAALIGGVAYGLTTYYLGYVTDQALRERMMIEYESLGLPLPPGLVSLESKWNLIGQLEEAYDDEDVVEAVFRLDAQARPIPNPADDALSLMDPDLPYLAAVQAARDNGSDFRTVFTSNGVHARLLTYQLPSPGSVAFLQMGKVLVEEDRIKHRLLLILFLIGTAFIVVSGGASWWLTGRSLRSTKFMWEQQQTFVANASHELRTPLTLIRASTQVLQLSLEPSNPQRQLLDDVINETDYMSRLVDDMLILSRLDAGQLQLDTSTIDLAELLPKIVRPFASLAREHGVDVSLIRAEGVVLADSIRLWQVLLIMLDNALRHTPAGGRITLESEVRDQTVHIAVADTGDGIDPVDLPHVFERFYKADSSRSDRHSAGLGLSIAKPLVELHGGEMNIQSTRGVGTLATITLRAQFDPQITESEPDFSRPVIQG